MRIAIAAGQGGYGLRTVVAAHLADGGHAVIDLGTDSEGSVHYPPFCAAAGRAVVAAAKAQLGRG